MNRKDIKRRKEIIRVYDHLYDIETFGQRLVCAYCGDTRHCLDHIPPVSLIDKYGSKELRKRGISFIKVPSCKKCNDKLSSRPLFTYYERLAFLYRTLELQIENGPIWTEGEIEDSLTGELKRMVKARSERYMKEVIDRFRVVERNMAKADI